MAQGVLQLGTERENRPRLLLRLPPGGGQHQTPPHPVEQRHPEGLLQLGDLTADGLRREMQLFGGLRHAAAARHMPEVVELFVVEHAVPYQFFPNNHQ